MSKLIEYLTDYEAEAMERKSSFGKTDKYTTGLPGLDTYLGEGFGKPHGYEIITVFGTSGVGKSTFALNMVAREIVNGTKVGFMILEDDMPDVYLTMLQIVGHDGMNEIKKNKNVELLPRKMREGLIFFDKILKWIEDKHNESGIDLFLIDHINFLFDNAEVTIGDKEMAAQRRFMLNLNFLTKRLKLTVILVSHTAKGNAEGMDKIYGTSSIPQVSTKVIEVKLGEGSQMIIKAWKNRFARRQDNPWQMNRVGLKLEESGKKLTK